MITNLMSLFDAYNEADRELRVCEDDWGDISGQICYVHQEKKDDIAARIDEALRKIIRTEIEK